MTIFYVGWPCPECKRSIGEVQDPFGNYCPKCRKCAECVEYEKVTDLFCAKCKPEVEEVEIEEILSNGNLDAPGPQEQLWNRMMGVPRRVDGNTAWDAWEASKI